MFPHAVHEGAGEERVFRIRHPGCESDASIGVFRNLDCGCAECPGFERMSRFRVVHLAAIDGTDHATVAGDPGEKGGKAMIILLRPAVRRMGMAAGAADLRAEKNPPDMLG